MKRLGKRQIIGIIVVAVMALAVGLFVWSFSHPFSEGDEPASTTTPAISNTEPETPPEPKPERDDPKEADASSIDPATVSTVAIEQLGVSVAYIKGLSGFSYSINQSTDGTQYAAFSSDQLAGTKCTDDVGVFATIVKNPQSQEDQTTLSARKTVNGTLYGLSLPSATCTSDSALFSQYQASFKDAFGLIQPL